MLKELAESRFNTSESVDSGIFETDDLCCGKPAKKVMNIGEMIREILITAQKENRVISGLTDVSKHFKEAENSDLSLFFFVAPTPTGDSLKHMQEVMLQAFCFENDIYIVKIDSSEKLSEILGSVGITCALTQKLSRNQTWRERYTEHEKVLIDHCENFWDEPVQPIIRLPEK